jgi:SAM-dependent methyltransferase
LPFNHHSDSNHPAPAELPDHLRIAKMHRSRVGDDGSCYTTNRCTIIWGIPCLLIIELLPSLFSRSVGKGKQNMRDVVTGFYVNVLRRLIDKGIVSTSDRVLVVCGGPLDEKVMAAVGFTNATITNLDDGMANNREDVEDLSFDDGSFDLVVVHAGLHHCRSPHRALLEMYRVARKCAVAFEARNSLLMRAAIRLGLTIDYELESVSVDFKSGGVQNGPIPNFIYRWTERDVQDAIASYDPAYQPKIDFFYDLRIPVQRFTNTGRTGLRLASKIIVPLSRLFARLAPKQCNEFAFAITKTRELQPWMETETLMSRDYATARNRIYAR